MRILLFAFVIACGGSSGAGGDDAPDGLDGLVSIDVTPKDQTLVIAQGVAATSAYTATGTFSDGRVVDITPHVAFALDEGTLGVFEAATLTTATDHGGQTTVTALANGVQGATGVTIRFQ